jgi:hypothetical protein
MLLTLSQSRSVSEIQARESAFALRMEVVSGGVEHLPRRLIPSFTRGNVRRYGALRCSLYALNEENILVDDFMYFIEYKNLNNYINPNPNCLEVINVGHK